MANKWNPIWWFKNDDEPVCPSDLWTGRAPWYRQFRWFLRNPFHNFTFYVIGVADKTYTVSGQFPHDVFNPNGGWKYHVVNYRWLWLPFVSYYGDKWMLYLGWRERGNFGMKWRKV